MVVIAIVATVSTLIFVSMASVKNRANYVRAKVQIKQLEKAFVAYHDEYGSWPKGVTGFDGLDDRSMESKPGILLNEDAVRLLRGEDVAGLNPRQIVFYEISDSQVRVDNDGVKGFVDPWNCCYKYMMDFDDDGVLTIDFAGVGAGSSRGAGGATNTIGMQPCTECAKGKPGGKPGGVDATSLSGFSVVVWSQGPDNDDYEQGDNIASWCAI